MPARVAGTPVTGPRAPGAGMRVSAQLGRAAGRQAPVHEALAQDTTGPSKRNQPMQTPLQCTKAEAWVCELACFEAFTTHFSYV